MRFLPVNISSSLLASLPSPRDSSVCSRKRIWYVSFLHPLTAHHLRVMFSDPLLISVQAYSAECQWTPDDCLWRISCNGNAEGIFAEFIKVVRGIIAQGGWDGYYSDSDNNDEDLDGSIASFDSDDNETYVRQGRNVSRFFTNN
jgi:hypothetical protein